MPASSSTRMLWVRLRFALLCAAVVTVIGLAIQGLGWEFREFRTRSAHTAMVAALVALAARPAIEGLARRALGVLGPVALWRALSIAAVALALNLSQSLSYVLRSSYTFLGYSSRLWEQEPEFVTIPIAAFVAGLFASAGSTTSARRIRTTSVAATSAALLLCALGAARAARTTELHRWVQAIPLSANLQGMGGDRPQRGDPSVSYAKIEHVVGDARVGIYAFADRSVCVALVARRAEALPERVLFEPYTQQMCPCRRVQVHSHERAGIIAVSDEPNDYQAYYPNNLALDARTGRPVSATEARIRREISAPNAWLAMGFASSLAALALLLVRGRERQALDRIGQWREAKLRDDRMIELPNGTVIVCPYSLPMEPGPVVITTASDQRAQATPFRDAPAAAPERDELYAGTTASVAASLEAAIDARNAAALFAATAGAAPMLAALSQGLLL